MYAGDMHVGDVRVGDMQTGLGDMDMYTGGEYRPRGSSGTPTY